MRAEGQPATKDPAVNEAYDGLGATYKFYWDVFRRDSIDGAGMALHGLVHFGSKYNNAFWDGEEMVFGDGDGVLFTRFTASLDVIGHELTHGVTQYEANLVYSGQSGALNESISDVFGSLVKQYKLNQTAKQADWLIGADCVGRKLKPALRSMKAPGTANPYDDQPADMDHYVRTTEDHGGVHTNSGIPNLAFCHRRHGPRRQVVGEGRADLVRGAARPPHPPEQRLPIVRQRHRPPGRQRSTAPAARRSRPSGPAGTR